MRRGAVGFNVLIFPMQYPSISGFHVTFEDGFEIDHAGGLIDLDDRMIQEHGRVMNAKAIAGGRSR